MYDLYEAISKEIPRDPIDDAEYEEYDNNEKKLRSKNQIVYSDLVLSIDDEVCFGLVMSCKTEQIIEGDAYMSWKKLNEKYNSRSKSTKIALKKQYMLCKAEHKQDPDIWITKMENLRYNLMSRHNDVIND